MSNNLTMWRVILTVLLLSIAIASARADEPQLKGQLLGPESTPVPNFPMIVLHVDEDENVLDTYVTTTDEDGVFSIENLPSGIYIVVPANEPNLERKTEIAEGDFSWFGSVFGLDNKVGTADVGIIELDRWKNYHLK